MKLKILFQASQTSQKFEKLGGISYVYFDLGYFTSIAIKCTSIRATLEVCDLQSMNVFDLVEMCNLICKGPNWYEFSIIPINLENTFYLNMNDELNSDLTNSFEFIFE